jgi:glucuronate isomerase
VVNIEKETFTGYVARLAEVTGIQISDIEALKKALIIRMDYFARHGCSVSDHGLDYVPYSRCNEERLSMIFAKGLQGQALSSESIECYKTEMLRFFAEEYARRGWVMQLHYGCHRDNNRSQFAKLGPDTGYDSISNYTPSDKLAMFLGAVEAETDLPKTILYSLNPADNAVIGTIIGCFQGSGVAGKIQHGSAWWFNDHKKGMEEQMASLANLGVLGKFIGMLTDSRSFLSYTRHEYFRRILCNLIGTWVEDGEFPAEEALLENLVRGIAHDNAEAYFEF